MPISMRFWKNRPMTLKVRKNTRPMMAINAGMAVYLPVRNLSMRLLRQLLLALVGFYNRLRHQLLNKVEAHIRNGGGAVQPALLLHLHDDMLDHFFFVLVQLQGFLNAGSPSTSLVAANRTGMPAALA